MPIATSIASGRSEIAVAEDSVDCLKRLPYWGNLTEKEKLQIRDHAVIQNFAKGQLIHGCGNYCLGMILVLKGTVRTYILSEEGREVTLFRLYQNDSCVLSADCVIFQVTFETQMTAEEDTQLLVIPSGFFGKLTEQNIYVRCFMYEILTERFSAVMWSMQKILFEGYDRRLASFLVGEYERTGTPTIKMTHEQIAQNTSSAREVVARMLKRFSADGLVEMRRGEILLKDLDGLKKLL